jgi:hypothetical protein
MHGKSWKLCIMVASEGGVLLMMERVRERYWRLPLALISQLLALQWILAEPLAAQQPLRVVVLEGEGNKNVTQQISPRPLVVRVESANNGAVEGAAVTFTAPGTGPSGDFANDSRTIRVVTGPDGVASPGLYHPSGIEGRYSIQVRAEYQGAAATALISQTNVAQGGGHKKLIAILVVAGAAGAAALAARNKNSGASSPATITFGGSAVGAPR